MYIHERKQWPHFTWDKALIDKQLLEVRHLQGRLLGRLEALGLPVCEEATFQSLTQDVLKTSEIEGETLDIQQVRSSLARKLGIKISKSVKVDRSVNGVVAMMLDATQNYAHPLTQERLFGWHASLFPKGKSGTVKAGRWRGKSSGAMQVVSGAYGHEKIHYEAPTYDRLASEMKIFFKWIQALPEQALPEQALPEMDRVLQAALAHFWFVTIHPFEDGNGRMARAIADSLLARSEKSSQRFYSMSSQIQAERKEYYDVLERCQKGSLDITLWMEWFLNCLKRAMQQSENMLATVLGKSRFWKAHAGESFNDRQRSLLNRLLDGFEGKLTSSKWAKLAKCSQDTALRDIACLLERKILIKEDAGGRNTHYQLVRPQMVSS